MSTEKYIGEAALKDSPNKKINLMIRDGSVGTRKLADSSVTTAKVATGAVTSEKIGSGEVQTANINDSAITTAKITDSAVVTGKIADSAVTEGKISSNAITTAKIAAGAVTEEKITDSSVTLNKLAEASVATEKIVDRAITSDKILQNSVKNEHLTPDAVHTENVVNASITEVKLAEGAVSNSKIAADTITRDKFDPELRKTIEAATGLSDDLIFMIQDIDQSLAKLNDTVYPIALGFTVTPNVTTMKTAVAYSVSSDGKVFTPDTLTISKKVNEAEATVLTDMPISSGTLTTNIEGGKEVFTFAVTKEGKTNKSTSTTRYLCYYGGNPTETITPEVMNTLTRISATGVSFNPTVVTRDNDYIWLVVPNCLTINKVTSAGFDVTLSKVQTVTNSFGTFKAYRTVNKLTAESWKLVVS